MGTVLRTTARVGGTVVMIVLATGCLRAHQDLTLNEDNTVDGTIIFAVDRELLEIGGQSLEDFEREMGSATGLPPGIEAERTPYEDGDFVGSEFTFSGAPLEVWNDAGEANRVSITREGDTFVVRGTFDATGEEFNDPDLPELPDLGSLDVLDIQVSVTFPGEVASHNGELDGTTVTWKLGFGQVNEIEAVGSALGSGGSGSAILVWILLVVAVAAGTALVVLLVASRKKQATPAGAPTGEEQAAAAPEPTTAPMPPPTAVQEPPPAPVPVAPPEAPATEPIVEPPGTTSEGPGGTGGNAGDDGGATPGGD